MSNFKLYANYYDLLYKDKNYKKEVEYIIDLIPNDQSSSNSRILDFGCGTGMHANIMSSLLKDAQIDGLDISEEMINLAKAKFGEVKNLNFFHGSISSYDTKNKYNLITSLFHVFSYLTDNKNIINTLKSFNNLLDDNGLLIFDFWNGSGVLTEIPEKRIKELENTEIKATRKAFPEMFVNKNLIDVNYTIEINEKNEKRTSSFTEKHTMRYFFKPEIELFLSLSGFKIVNYLEWLTFDEPKLETWNAVVVAQKYKSV